MYISIEIQDTRFSFPVITAAFGGNPASSVDEPSYQQRKKTLTRESKKDAGFPPKTAGMTNHKTGILKADGYIPVVIETTGFSFFAKNRGNDGVARTNHKTGILNDEKYKYLRAIVAAVFTFSTAVAIATPSQPSLATPAATIVPAETMPQPGQVVAAGTVLDEATKAGVLARLTDIYGAGNVIDQIAVGGVAAPANWSAQVQKLLGPQLKQVSKGKLRIDGTQVELRGEVGNEAQRQQIASDMATALNPTYTVKNGLRVSAFEQGLLDQTLANRIIEFETGSANLTSQGRGILDEMLAVLPKLSGRTIEIIGHTDNSGSRATNLALSQERADTVRKYLTDKGAQATLLSSTGVGPDQPVAANTTADGRARNRRIEFRAGQ